jgi:hypothetical protein
MTQQFNIGDTIYVATCTSVEKWLPCPDCHGKKFLTVILGDDSRVTIDCDSCTRGYLGPCGLICSYEYEPAVDTLRVEYIDSRDGEIRYNYRDPDVVFGDPHAAEIRAAFLKEELTRAESARLEAKEQPKRTWAWNVRYHRGCLKEAQRQIEYHTSKLNAALTHAKEEKKAKEL